MSEEPKTQEASDRNQDDDLRSILESLESDDTDERLRASNELRKKILNAGISDPDRFQNFRAKHNGLLEEIELTPKQGRLLADYINDGNNWETAEENHGNNTEPSGVDGPPVAPIPTSPVVSLTRRGRTAPLAAVRADATSTTPSASVPTPNSAGSGREDVVGEADSAPDDNSGSEEQLKQLQEQIENNGDTLDLAFMKQLDTAEKVNMLRQQLTEVQRSVLADQEKLRNEREQNEAYQDNGIFARFRHALAKINTQIGNIDYISGRMASDTLTDEAREQFGQDLLEAWQAVQRVKAGLEGLVKTVEKPFQYADALIQKIADGHLICQNLSELPSLQKLFTTNQGQEKLLQARDDLQAELRRRKFRFSPHPSGLSPAQQLQYERIESLQKQLAELAALQTKKGKVPHTSVDQVRELYEVFGQASLELRNLKYPNEKRDYAEARKEYLEARTAWLGQKEDKRKYKRPALNSDGSPKLNDKSKPIYKIHNPNQAGVVGIKDRFESYREYYELRALERPPTEAERQRYETERKKYEEARQRYLDALQKVMAARGEYSGVATLTSKLDQYNFRESKNGGPVERSRIKMAAVREMILKPNIETTRTVAQRKNELRGEGKIKDDLYYFKKIKGLMRWPSRVLLGGAVIMAISSGPGAVFALLSAIGGGLVGGLTLSELLQKLKAARKKELSDLFTRADRQDVGQRAELNKKQLVHLEKIMSGKGKTWTDIDKATLSVVQEAERMDRTMERRKEYGRLVGGLAGGVAGGAAGIYAVGDVPSFGQMGTSGGDGMDGRETLDGGSGGDDLGHDSAGRTEITTDLTDDTGGSESSVESSEGGEVFDSNQVEAEPGDNLIKMMREAYGDELFGELTEDQQHLAEAKWREALNADSDFLKEEMGVKSGNADLIQAGETYDLGPGADKLAEIVREVEAMVPPGEYQDGIYSVKAGDTFSELAYEDQPGGQSIFEGIKPEHQVQAWSELVKYLNADNHLHDYGFNPRAENVDQIWPGDQLNWTALQAQMKSLAAEHNWLEDATLDDGHLSEATTNAEESVATVEEFNPHTVTVETLKDRFNLSLSSDINRHHEAVINELEADLGQEKYDELSETDFVNAYKQTMAKRILVEDIVTAHQNGSMTDVQLENRLDTVEAMRVRDIYSLTDDSSRPTFYANVDGLELGEVDRIGEILQNQIFKNVWVQGIKDNITLGELLEQAYTTDPGFAIYRNSSGEISLLKLHKTLM